jgi:hypothetical protein
MCAELKNPFDALQILAKAAVNDPRSSDQNSGSPGLDHLQLDPSIDRHDLGDSAPDPINSDKLAWTENFNQGTESYKLVTHGTLDIEAISELLQK